MKKYSIRLLCTWLLIVLGGAWTVTQLAGCHTVQGAGQDVSAAGEGITDVTKKVTPY